MQVAHVLTEAAAAPSASSSRTGVTECVSDVSYLHTRYERREAEHAPAQEGVHVAPQLLFDPPALLRTAALLHFLEDAREKGAEQLLG